MVNQKVVVTGGNGFLGKHVIGELKNRGFNDIHIIRSNKYDLSEQEQVRRMFQDFNPDIVIHLAAVVGGIGANKANPGLYFYKNIMMGTMLLEEARIHGVKKFTAIGTICAYPKLAKVPFKEESIWDGYPEETNAPYGLAKKMMLVQSQAYREQYGFNSIYLLPVNLYGPHDNFNNIQTSHVIPAIIRKIFDAKSNGDKNVVLWGDGSVSREFLYVEDAARAIVKATCEYDGNEPINIGTGEEITIKSLVSMIKEEIQYNGEIIWDINKPNGQPRRCLDTTKAKNLIGWTAKIPLKEGLNRTIQWYDCNKQWICSQQ